MKKGISGRALFILTAGLGLCILVSWLGLRSRQVAEPPREGHDAEPPATEIAVAPAFNEGTDPTPEQSEWDLLPLPLDTVLAEPENDMWLTDAAYLRVPRGIQTFGGIEFHLDAMIQMQGTSSKSAGRGYRSLVRLPLAEAGLQRSRIACIHLLCGTRFTEDPDAEVAAIVWHYNDRQQQQTPIRYLEHVRDWNRPAYDEPQRLPYPLTKVVWRSGIFSQSGRQHRLYRLTLANPEPDKPVQTMELISGKGRATLFVVAATLDSLPAGARPDDLPDLEPIDEMPAASMTAYAQTPTGQALPGARFMVETVVRKTPDAGTIRHFSSDSSGTARITIPQNNFDRLQVTASHEDYAARRMIWDIAEGESVPASYIFQLAGGVAIGGTIVDEADSPVAGAKISMYRFWQGGESTDPKENPVSFSRLSVTTDSNGAWAARNLPEELLDRIGLEASHPDYLQTNFHLSEGRLRKQLLAGTSKIVLRKGILLTGLVLNENNVPIPGATVWVGKRYYQDRKETKTDATGRFIFEVVSPGETALSAMAEGFSPEVTTTTIAAGMPEVILVLKPGVTIRGIVQDAAAAPISGVRVVLEGTGTSMAREDALEFTTRTGQDGRFEWKAAPNKPMPFYFGKSGYMQVRDRKLEPEKDNVITLQKEQEIEGYVLDANTGQPVTRFKVGIGRSYGRSGGEEDFYPDHPGLKDTSNANGRFTVSRTELQTMHVKVTADDYAPQVQRIPGADDGAPAVMQFHLKQSPSLRGVVVLPDGQPAPGANVTLAREGAFPQGATFSKGRLQGSSQTSISVADAEGRFVLGSIPETGGTVFAAGKAGAGSATVEEVRATGRLVLEPYGQIEGVLKIGGRPTPGQQLLFTLTQRGITTDFQAYRTETDSQGKFTFTDLPVGPGEITRLVQTRPTAWMHNHKTSVNVEAGRTVFITLGDSGAIIRGVATLPSFPGEDPAKLRISGRLSTRLPPHPSRPGSTLSEAEFRALVKAANHHAFILNADGSFLIDSVGPGEYGLTISVTRPGVEQWSEIQVGSGSSNVTVPENIAPGQEISVGEVVVSPLPTQGKHP